MKDYIAPSMMALTLTSIALALAVLAGCQSTSPQATNDQARSSMSSAESGKPDQAMHDLETTTERAIVNNAADMAFAIYSDAYTTARDMQTSIDQFIAEPTEENLSLARQAWKTARVPYLQSEVFRFGNPVVDDWEGKVNAWPLDEGLIDQVDASYGSTSAENQYYTANIIANPQLMIGGQTVDASTISADFLRNTLHEAGEIESNVATGYHAIEFLLWGQDLNGTNAGSGERPASDFKPNSCTAGNCERRIKYLQAASQLLVDDLQWMTNQWAEDASTGSARQALTGLSDKDALGALVTGMGSLSLGELAGERMQLGLLVHDPEEEQDCFSDNTHAAHFYDAKGVQNLYNGVYQRTDGSLIEGPSLALLVEDTKPSLHNTIQQSLQDTMAAMQKIVDSAENDGIAYDQLIGENNPEGNTLVSNAITNLLQQTKAIAQLETTLELDNISIESSDSLQ